MAKKKETTKKEPPKKIICTSCGEERVEKAFGKSYSFRDKLTGRLPICKACCAELFDRLMLDYQDEMKALYRFCMILDLYFSKDTAMALISKSKNNENNLGYLYVIKYNLVQYKNKTFSDTNTFINIYGMTDEEMEEALYLNTEKTKEEIERKTKEVVTEEVIKRWGSDLELDDYIFLEERYNQMLEAYDDKNPSSLWSYQEICMNYLLLRKDRGNVQLQKSIQEINSKLQADCKMKLSQIDNDEDDNACFGKFIDRIENYEPCEKKLPFFDDIDGIRKYIKRWFVQPFAREWGVAKTDVLDNVDRIEDYEDINSIYREQEENAKKEFGEDNDE